MSLTVEDLKPKSFTVTVKGVELQCKPLRLSHALTVAKIGNVFQESATASAEQISQAEKDMDAVIAELIPELKGIELDVGAVLELIEQMMKQIQPADNKELTDKGVSFGTDPKAGKIG